MYRYMNMNPEGNNVDDCTVRAISVAEGISWDEAYRKLSNAARRKGLMMDSADFIEGYLDEKYHRICYKEKIVAEFMENNPTGTYLITMPNHITVIKDGFLYDTWDCSKKIMWCAWRVS